MTAHRIRLVHSQNGSTDFHNWLDTWLTNMTPWDWPEVSNDLPTLREPLGGGTQYYQTELAFDWNAEDKAIILDNLEQYMDSYCDWYRMVYHVCPHDEDEVSACSWEDKRESSTAPPSDVPDWAVNA